MSVLHRDGEWDGSWYIDRYTYVYTSIVMSLFFLSCHAMLRYGYGISYSAMDWYVIADVVWYAMLRYSTLNGFDPAWSEILLLRTSSVGLVR